MPSERPRRRIHDMLHNIGRIRRHLNGREREDFLADEMMQDAVERCFERITEAARKLGDGFDADHPEARLPTLRAFGSVLRHDYDRVNPVLIWNFAVGRLDGLENALRAILAGLPD